MGTTDAAIDEGWESATALLTPPKGRRMLAAIVFADMVDYSKMMDDNEHHAYVARTKYRAAVRRAIERYDGDLVQEYGDGALMIYPSAVDAVRASRRIQRELALHPNVPVRIGVHVSEVVRDDEGVYGTGVNIAARIQALCTPGGVLMSAAVNRELRNKGVLETASIGSHQLKNISTPVQLSALVDPATDGSLANPEPATGTVVKSNVRSTGPIRSRVQAWIQEITRRKVHRMAKRYVLATLVTLQATSLAISTFGLPHELWRWALIATAGAAPIALALSWMYDLSVTIRSDRAM